MRHSIGPTATLASITRDSITNCPDVEPFLGDTRLLGDVLMKQESWKLEFWVRFFEQDPSALARFLRVANAPMQALRDLAKLNHAVNGTPTLIPTALVELIRQRVMLAYFPSADQVVKRATQGSALYAQRCLFKFIEVEEWHARG